MNFIVMKNSTQHIRFKILILMILFFACSTQKKAESSEGSDKDSEIVMEGSYMYIAVAKLSATHEEMNQVKRDIDIMLSKIPGILDVSSGIQASENAKYNWGLAVRFKDKAAREAYASNPDHKAFGERYGGIVVELEIVEYEVNPSP